jgi:adenylylsulfate kinase-like enzyme
MTGIDAPYEAPDNAEMHIETMNQSPEESAILILQWLREKGYLSA